MKVTYLYTGDDGQSHFEDIDLAATPIGTGEGIELRGAIQGLLLLSLPSSFSNEYHNAPRRQFVLQLTGRGEYTVGDGTSRILGPGDVLLVDDRTGQGHLSRTIEEPRLQAYIYVDPDLDIDSLRVQA